MKKIFTLLVLSTTIFTAASAQYGGKGYGVNKGNDAVYNDGRYKKDHDRNDRYYFSKRERDMAIVQINREYDNKIQSVKRNYFMGHFKKQRIISSLEDQRRAEIRNVFEKFNDRRNRFDDNDSRNRW